MSDPQGYPPNPVTPPVSDDAFDAMVEKSVYRQKAIRVTKPGEAAPDSFLDMKPVGGAPPGPNDQQFDDMVEKSVYRQQAVKVTQPPPSGVSRATTTPPPPAAGMNWLIPMIIGLAVLLIGLIVALVVLSK